MKVLTIKINDKTHATGKITAFYSKEAMRIQKEAISVAKLGKGFQDIDGIDDVDKIEELFTRLEELKERKAWLICEIYGNKFDIESLQKELSDEEIDAEINKITNGISGIISKN